jgi:hypothetical protein
VLFYIRVLILILPLIFLTNIIFLLHSSPPYQVQPFLARTIGLDDTCGVHNLHGMPGVLGAIAGAISAISAGNELYGDTVAKVFPSRAPSNATLAATLGVDPGSDRSASDQAAYQIAALVVTLVLSIVGGMFTGMIIKMPIFLPGLQEEKAKWCECGKSTLDDYWYEDEYYWNVEHEETQKEYEQEQLLSKERLKRSLDYEISKLESQRSALQSDEEKAIATTTNGEDEGKIESSSVIHLDDSSTTNVELVKTN